MRERSTIEPSLRRSTARSTGRKSVCRKGAESSLVSCITRLIIQGAPDHQQARLQATGEPMDFTRLKKLAGFYGRFLVSFSAVGYRARSLFWTALRADFTGRTWVVTGATGGIGRAIVEGATSR